MSILVGASANGVPFRDDWKLIVFVLSFFVFFFYEIFLFPFFETLNGTRRLHLGESREIPPFFVVVEILALSARVSLRQFPAFIPCFVPKTEKDQRASSPSFYPLFRSNRHPVVLIGPSTSRHSKWRADSNRFREFSPSTLDCMIQTKTGEHVPASLPQWFLLTLVGQNMWI